MRILLTLLKPTSGVATVAGLDVVRHPVQVRRLTGWVPPERTVDPLLTTGENLAFMAGMYHLSGSDARRREPFSLLALATFALRRGLTTR
jgi:ABC-2 type transport system ATP-binding protein